MDIDDAMTNAGWLLYWFKFIFIFGWFLLLGRVLCCQVDYCGSIWWFVSKMGLSERNLNGVRFEFDPNSTDKFETQTLHESKKSKRIRCCWMSNAAGKVCNREWISELKSGDSIFCFVLFCCRGLSDREPVTSALLAASWRRGPARLLPPLSSSTSFFLLFQVLYYDIVLYFKVVKMIHDSTAVGFRLGSRVRFYFFINNLLAAVVLVSFHHFSPRLLFGKMIHIRDAHFAHVPGALRFPLMWFLWCLMIYSQRRSRSVGLRSMSARFIGAGNNFNATLEFMTAMTVITARWVAVNDWDNVKCSMSEFSLFLSLSSCVWVSVIVAAAAVVVVVVVVVAFWRWWRRWVMIATCGWSLQLGSNRNWFSMDGGNECWGFFFVSFSVPIFVVVVFDFTFAIEQKSVWICSGFGLFIVGGEMGVGTAPYWMIYGIDSSGFFSLFLLFFGGVSCQAMSSNCARNWRWFTGF